MVSGSESTMRVLAPKAEIEKKALMRLRYVASTVSVSPQYVYLCRQLEPIPWEHLGLGLRNVAMPNELRMVIIKPFG